MKKKNYNIDMINPVSSISKTVCHTGYTEDMKQLVIAVGYNKNNKFGYFLCWESRDDNQDHVYSDQIEFIEKVDEKCYQRALTEIKKLVESFQKPSS